MSNKHTEINIESEGAMLDFGKKLAKVSSLGNIFYLHGELGAGKTTLARGFLREFGHEGAVKSPTYTIVEHYLIDDQHIYHFDLYRLTDAEELEFMGAREYFHQQAICLLEWAENGEGFLPQADLEITIFYEDLNQRRIQLVSKSSEGQRILREFSEYSQ